MTARMPASRLDRHQHEGPCQPFPRSRLDHCRPRTTAWGDKTPAKQRTHFPADTGHIVVRAQGACPAAVAVLA